ncbi:MAG: hypothetical protein ACJ71D_08325 [Nitrososphaera sp.]
MYESFNLLLRTEALVSRCRKLPNARMIGARSYFTRMNENRGDTNWLNDEQLLNGTEQFFRLNQYSKIDYNKLLDQGERTFSSPILASRLTEDSKDEQIDETIVCFFKSRITNYDLSFFGTIESFTFNILDNYESTNPMLVTDSLSYTPIVKNQEISVAIEDMMREGLFILFLNDRFAYAFFDNFESMTKPIPL